MKILHAILLPLAFAAAGAVAAAGDESESAVPSGHSAASAQVAQAGDGMRVGDDRFATLGDLRHMEGRLEGRISQVENRISQLEDRVTQMFVALLTVMIVLYGLPHIPAWWGKFRANGRPPEK